MSKKTHETILQMPQMARYLAICLAKSSVSKFPSRNQYLLGGGVNFFWFVSLPGETI